MAQLCDGPARHGPALADIAEFLGVPGEHSLSSPDALRRAASFDAELGSLRAIWPALPPHVRDAIWTLVDASQPLALEGP